MLNQSDPLQLARLDPEGNIMTSGQARKFETGARTLEVTTPNLCDQTTWYQQAEPFESLTVTSLSPTEKKVVFLQPSVLVDPMTINAQEGRILMADGSFDWRESFKITAKENGFDVTNDIESIDYQNAIITFKAAKLGIVTVSGYAVKKSDPFMFVIQITDQTVGFNIFEVINSEIQFSTDIQFSQHAIRFEVLSSGPYMLKDMPYDTTVMGTTAYKSMATHPLAGHFGTRRDYLSWKDFEAVSNVGKNIILPWAGKGITSIEFPMPFLASFTLEKAQGSGLRIFCIGQNGGTGSGPLEGTYGTLTVYGKLGRVI